MQIDFPAHPVPSQLHFDSDLSWQWDGYKWGPPPLSRGPVFLVATDFGAAGDGTTDDTAALFEWITACVDRGMPGFLPTGTYMVTKLNVLGIARDLSLYGGPGATIKGFYIPEDVPVTWLDADHTIRPRLKINGITFDNSLRVILTAYGTSSALHLGYFSYHDIRECSFLSTMTREESTADAGLTTVACGSGVIDHCFFRGQADSGLYTSGGSSLDASDDYGDLNITNCYFFECGNSAIVKRQQERILFHGNHVEQCLFGFSNAEGDSSGVTLDPARVCVVSNNLFRRTISRAITAHCGPYVVTGNIIEDWGYFPDGTPNGPPQSAIRWNASNGICSNNIMRFTGTWPEGVADPGRPHMGIRLRPQHDNRSDRRNHLHAARQSILR